MRERKDVASTAAQIKSWLQKPVARVAWVDCQQRKQFFVAQGAKVVNQTDLLDSNGLHDWQTDLAVTPTSSTRT